jgi:hypothetical protein
LTLAPSLAHSAHHNLAGHDDTGKVRLPSVADHPFTPLTITSTANGEG